MLTTVLAPWIILFVGASLADSQPISIVTTTQATAPFQRSSRWRVDSSFQERCSRPPQQYSTTFQCLPQTTIHGTPTLSQWPFSRSRILQIRGGTIQPNDAKKTSFSSTNPLKLNNNNNNNNTVPLLTATDNNDTNASIHQLFQFNNNNNNNNNNNSPPPYNPLRLYQTCMAIVATWMAVGTIFYATINHWPWHQAFFYAVDAGMSIGFCTDGVTEERTISKAFTIVYILLGASVVGGALSIFLQHSLHDFATPTVHEYQLLLERQAFDAADVDHSGVLTKDQFLALLRAATNEESLSSQQLHVLWTHFDRLHDGVIHFEQEFAGHFRSLHKLVKLVQERSNNRHHPVYWFWRQLKRAWHIVWNVEHRIYFVLLVWLSMGIAWGMLDQQWDLVTAIHFAVSALATGGLTGPRVNPDGILPADPSLFCGIFCLLGIPLFGLALGHFAKVLVASHLCAMETAALARPMTEAEYKVASQLVTKHDSMVHLSDYIVLQLLRQGKLSVRAIELLQHNFDALDTDNSGVLTLEQATFDHTLPKTPTDGAAAAETGHQQ